MGACGSSGGGATVEPVDPVREAKAKELDKLLEQEKDVHSQIINLLLLGTGGCGKTTFLKQMRMLYGEFLNDEESKREWTSVIRENMFSNMSVLCNQLTEHETLKPTEALAEEVKASTLHLLQDLSKLKVLWADENIQEMFKLRFTFTHETNMEYFFEDIDRILADNYVPNVEDILAARKMTVGIVETQLIIVDNNKPSTLNIIDVGGQRNQRRKWISMFDGVTAIIFLTALSEYNEKLAEDPTTEAMRESLSVFKSILRTKYFLKTPIILFLNKADVFREKIAKISIGEFFASAPQGEDGKDFDKALEFIKKRFMDLNNVKERNVYPHVTVATNKENVQNVFNSCKHVIMMNNLKSVGL